MRITKSMLAAVMLAALSIPALAQQPAQVACKGYYTVGETVPAGCAQQTINSSNYMSWGGASGASAASAPAPAPLFSHGPLNRGMMTR